MTKTMTANTPKESRSAHQGTAQKLGSIRTQLAEIRRKIRSNEITSEQGAELMRELQRNSLANYRIFH